MKTSALPKIHAVYDFFLKEGFQHTVQEIALAVKVTPKTLFNRYNTKANMVLEARKYWHQQIRERLFEKIEYCNNVVEKLVILICECHYCLQQESNYFMKELEDAFTCEENAFCTSLKKLLKEELDQNLLNSAVNPQEYAKFFMHNVYFYLPQHLNADTFFNLLSPVMLPEAQEIYNQIDINKIIHQ